MIAAACGLSETDRCTATAVADAVVPGCWCDDEASPDTYSSKTWPAAAWIRTRGSSYKHDRDQTATAV